MTEKRSTLIKGLDPREELEFYAFLTDAFVEPERYINFTRVYGTEEQPIGIRVKSYMPPKVIDNAVWGEPFNHLGAFKKDRLDYMFESDFAPRIGHFSRIMGGTPINVFMNNGHPTITIRNDKDGWFCKDSNVSEDVQTLSQQTLNLIEGDSHVQ